MSRIIGRPSYEFYNLFPFEREAAAQELFDASLVEDPDYRIKLVSPKDEKFYYVISELTEDGDFVETSRNPSEWATGLAIAAAWGQLNRESYRPTGMDIESMGAHFELIALKHFVALEKDVEVEGQA